MRNVFMRIRVKFAFIHYTSFSLIPLHIARVVRIVRWHYGIMTLQFVGEPITRNILGSVIYANS